MCRSADPQQRSTDIDGGGGTQVARRRSGANHRVAPVVYCTTLLASILVVGATTSCAAHVSVPQAAESRDDPRADFRPTPWEPFSPRADGPPRGLVIETLCADDAKRCIERCDRNPHGATFAECATELRYAEDGASMELARAMLKQVGAIPGIESRTTISGAHLGLVPIEPAVPVGADRHHLRWILSSLLEFEQLFAAVSRLAVAPVLYRTRPRAFRFYRTAAPSFPSATANLRGTGVVSYNLRGLLHRSRDAVAETLFHEVFHLNDEGHGRWSERVLAPHYLAIRQQCASEHDCLEPYAPDDTMAVDGTYYAFDPRTGSPREYGAELALRWFREHRALLTGTTAPADPPFKCRTEINGAAWREMVAEFFGGVDLVPSCEP